MYGNTTVLLLDDITLYKDYPTLAKHNSFNTGSYYTTKITFS
jgi:hypothetical protein